MEMVHFIPPCQRKLALSAAQSELAPVLICGSSGTGKGAIASWIHANGPRSTAPLLEARITRPLSSQIREAHGGTLLIPEISEWPLSEQKVLLSFLKTHSLPHPDGSGTPMLVSTRIIVTTSHDLQSRAEGGLFNPELLSRFASYRIDMPPLSRRTEEFEDIALGILRELTHDCHKEYLRELSTEAWHMLKTYEWPGNLRELRNVLKLAVSNAKGDQIVASDLPEFGHDRVDFRATRDQFEKIYLLELLKTFDWEVDRACQMTRMDPEILRKKMRHHGIEAPQATN